MKKRRLAQVSSPNLTEDMGQSVGTSSFFKNSDELRPKKWVVFRHEGSKKGSP